MSCSYVLMVNGSHADLPKKSSEAIKYLGREINHIRAHPFSRIIADRFPDKGLQTHAECIEHIRRSLCDEFVERDWDLTLSFDAVHLPLPKAICDKDGTHIHLDNRNIYFENPRVWIDGCDLSEPKDFFEVIATEQKDAIERQYVVIAVLIVLLG